MWGLGRGGYRENAVAGLCPRVACDATNVDLPEEVPAFRQPKVEAEAVRSFGHRDTARKDLCGCHDACSK